MISNVSQPFRHPPLRAPQDTSNKYIYILVLLFNNRFMEENKHEHKRK